MSIREVEYTDGTKLRWKGNIHEGKIGIDLEGFDFDKAVTQHQIIELYPEDCNELDLREGNIYKVYLTDNIADFSAVTGDVGTYIFIFVQDSTGGRSVTFDSNFYFASSVGRPDLSTSSANDIDIVSFLCDGEKFYGSFMQDFVNT
jgi:hypothetical protein